MITEDLEFKRARRREACKRYAERHPGKRREQYRISNAKRYAKNREKYLYKAKIYRQKNKEKLSVYGKNFRLNNPELYRERKRFYYQKNKERICAYQRTKESRYKISITSALKRGLEWNIGKSDYFELISSIRCHYRNHPLGISNGIGLDRIDNSKGYVIGNVVPCCGNCNRIKCHLLTYEEMIAVGKLLDEMSIKKAIEGVFPWR